MFALFFADVGVLVDVVPREGVAWRWSKGIKDALEQGLRTGTDSTKNR